jgi:molybdenum cofactor guanylyltransferase
LTRSTEEASLEPPRSSTAAISAVIVAGGKSRRLGQDKRALRLWGPDGPTLLEHTTTVMASLCDEVIVVLNDPQAWSALGARLVPDRFPGSGPLSGIYSGLEAARNPFVYVVASDMPLLNSQLLRWMIDHPRDYDVLVPRLGGARHNRLGVESLHAIYGHACLEPIRAQLEAGNPQVIGFYDQVRVRIVEPDIVAQHDPEGTSFLNVNTPDDLRVVRRHLERQQSAGADSDT